MRDKPGWLADCIRGKSGPISNVANVYRALENDPDLRDAVAYDEMLRSAMLMHPVGQPLASMDPRPVNDDDITEIQRFLQTAGLKTIGADAVHRAVAEYAAKRPYHPIRDYLQVLQWDQIKRIERFLPDYLGTQDGPYERQVGAMFLISMIARVMEPGCKADYMLVLEGEQGILKSQACRTLAGPWFSDSLPDITASAKDASVHLRGKWLIEIAELHAFSKAEATHLKSFISRTEEKYRPPYARMDVFEPRQCVFAGTTNKDTYLKDETGNRRYWPAKCGKINLAKLETDREQLLVEAFVAYLDGQGWWPDNEFEQQYIKPQQSDRYDGDAWEDLIRPFLSGKTELTLTEIAIGALGYQDPKTAGLIGNGGTPLNRLSKIDQLRIRSILTSCGWEPMKRLQTGTRRALFGPKSKEGRSM